MRKAHKKIVAMIMAATMIFTGSVTSSSVREVKADTGMVDVQGNTDGQLSLESDRYDVVVPYGEMRELSVVTSGGMGELSYKWSYYDAGYKAIENASQSTYKITGNKDTHAKYRCIVTDGVTEKYCYFYVTVVTGLNIEKDKYDINVPYGQEVTLEPVITGGTDEMTYTWSFYNDETNNYEQIQEVNSPSFTIKGEKGMYTQYKLEVDDGIKKASCVFNLTLDTGLKIENQTQTIDVMYGKDVVLDSMASGGAGALSYTWKYYDITSGEYVDVKGATQPTYTVVGNIGMSTVYKCIVTDGVIDKEIEFKLTLHSGLKVENETFNITIPYGETRELAPVISGGTDKKKYTWYYVDSEGKENIIADAIQSSYTVSGTKSMYNEYRLVIEDGVEKITCTFYLKLDTGLLCDESYQKIKVLYGENVELNPKVRGGAGDLSYTWYCFDGKNEYVPLEDITSSVYNVKGSKGMITKYKCIITDDVVTLECIFDLTLVTNLKVENGSNYLTVEYGKTAELTPVISGGADEKTYSWYCYDSSTNDYVLLSNVAKTYTFTAGKGTPTRYKMIVDDGVENVSCYFYITIDTGLAMETSYKSVQVSYDESVELDPKVSGGTGELIFTWYYYNEAGSKYEIIPDVNSATYSVVGKRDMATKYKCDVTDGIATKTCEFVIQLLTGLEIEKNTYSVEIPYNETMKLTPVISGGVGELDYEWYYYGEVFQDNGESKGYSYILIEDANDSTYSVTATKDTPGKFMFKVTDGIETESCYFNVTINTGLKLESNKKSVEVTYGETTQLIVVASGGAGELSYQWYYYDEKENKDLPIEGANTASYSVYGKKDIIKKYKCEVTDGISTLYCTFNLTLDTGLEIDTRNSYKIVLYGKTLDLMPVVTGGAGQLSYQWYYQDESKGEIAIEGATSHLYTVSGVKDMITEYTVKVTDGIETVSCKYHLSLDTGLVVETDNNNLTVFYGESDKLTVKAESKTGSLSYQWYYYDEKCEDYSLRYKIIDGEVKDTFTVNGTKDTYRKYKCVVSDGIIEKECEFNITIDTGLAIDRQAYNVLVVYGEEKVLTPVIRGGVGDLSYSWEYYDTKEGTYVKIPDAISATYKVSGTKDMWSRYRFSVSDGIMNKSCYFYLDLDTGLVVNADQTKVTIPYGTSKELVVSATGKLGELSYQWYKYTKYYDEDKDTYKYLYELIENATGTSYTVEGNKDTCSAYKCVVSDGIVQKECEFTIKIDTGLKLENTNRYVTVYYGETLELTVNATGGAFPLQYKWYYREKNNYQDKLISDAAGETYILTGTTDVAERYWCEVTDGIVTEKCIFYITLDTGLTVGNANQNITVPYGETVNLTVNATGGAGEISYKWYKYAEYYDESTGEYKKDYIVIEGAVLDKYSVSGDKEMCSAYKCEVTDGVLTKTVWFNTYLDTGLVLERTDIEQKVEYGKTQDLTVSASGGVGDLSYQWYYLVEKNETYKMIAGATGTSYTVTGKKDMYTTYKCEVTDGIVTKACYVNVVLETGLKLEKDTMYITVPYNETTDVTVNASGGAGELSYNWYKYQQVTDEYGETSWKYILIEDATTKTHGIFGDKSICSRYKCEVTDGILIKTCYVYPTLTTGLTIEKSYINVTVQYGETEKLTVSASGGAGELSYSWYYYGENKEDNSLGYNLIDGAVTHTFIVNGTKDIYKQYKCIVSDGIVEKDCEFNVTIDTGLTIDRSTYNMLVGYGEEKILTPVISGGVGELSYIWEYYDNIENTYKKVTDALAVAYKVYGTKDMCTRYRFGVTDGIMTKYCYFYLTLDTGLTVKADETKVIIPYGESKELTVNASGKIGEISYQWYKYVKYLNEEDNTYNYRYELIEGATNTSYKVEGNKDVCSAYKCVVADGIIEKECEFKITLDTGLKLENTYRYVTVYYGQTADLTVNASAGADKLQYKWYYYDKNTSKEKQISDAVNNTYVLNGTIDVSNRYKCEVTDGIVTETCIFYITLDTGLTIGNANQNVDVPYGGMANLTVNATGGAGEITYKWYKYAEYYDESTGEYKKDYIVIEGAVRDKYSVSGDKEMSSSYKCEVTDGVLTKTVWFNTYPDTGLVLERANIEQKVEYGKTQELIVSATGGVRELRYQWYYLAGKNETYTMIEGATDARYTVTGNKDMYTAYKCEVTDGIVTKVCYVHIMLDTGLKLEKDTIYINIPYNETVDITVGTSGGADELCYRWYKYQQVTDDYGEISLKYIPIEEANTKTYGIFGSKSICSRYKCEVTDGILTKTCYIYPTLTTGLIVENSYKYVTVQYGETKKLTVGASGGAGELSYQWYYLNKEGKYTLIEGENKNIYSVEGNRDLYSEYMCEVTDGIVTLSCYFNTTLSTGLEVEKSYIQQKVPYQEKSLLTVKATGGVGTPSYKWYQYESYVDEEGNVSGIYVLIADAKTDSLEVVGLKDMCTRYKCEVTDGILTKMCEFNLELDSGLVINKNSQYVSVPYGEQVELSVNASSNLSELTYNWYYLDKASNEYIAVDGVSGNTYTVDGSRVMPGQYRCYITDGVMTKMCQFYTSLDTGLRLDETTKNINVPYGQTIQVLVNAKGGLGELKYQWYYYDESNGGYMSIKDASTDTYSLAGTKDIHSKYKCVVSDELNTKECIINVVLDTGLRLDNSYRYVEVGYGKTVNLTTKATGGNGKIAYQWYVNTDGGYIPLSGALTDTYSVTGDVSMPLKYKCEVTDGIMVLTAYYDLILNTGLEVERAYNDLTVEYGKSIQLTVSAKSDIGEITYKWYKQHLQADGTTDYVEISDVKGNIYTIVGEKGIPTSYKCVVSDGILSKECYFDVTIDTGLTIAESDSYVKVEYGKSKELFINASGGVGELSYSWYSSDGSNNILIDGATTSSFVVNGTNDIAKSYMCEVTDGIVTKKCYFYTSLDTGLVVENPTNNLIVEYGKTAELVMEAKSVIPKLTYSWYYYNEDEKEYYLIETTDANTYTVKGDENLYNTYMCEVTDGILAKVSYFYTKLDTGLVVKEFEQTVKVPYGKSAELVMNATGGLGELSYKWYYYDGGRYYEITGAITQSYLVYGTTSMYTQIKGVATDGYVTAECIFYTELDTGLKANVQNDTVNVVYNETSQLVVNASSDFGNISYQWYYYDDYYVEISGATSNIFTVTGKNSMAKKYKCEVTDTYAKKSCLFEVKLDTKLSVGEDEVNVEALKGSKIQLVTEATTLTGYLSYKWYKYNKEEDRFVLVGNTYKDNCTVTADADIEYKCVVKDGVNEATKLFKVSVYDKEKYDIAKNCTIQLEYNEVVYDGKAKTPAVKVWHDKLLLVKDKDYTLTYVNNTKIGTASIKISGIGEYAGTVTKTFVIKQKATEKKVSISKAKVKLSKKSYVYDGKVKKPSVKVVLGGKTLINKKDYTVSYKNNKNIGTATVIIAGKGKYSSTVKAKFKIAVKKGKVYTIGNYKYKITSSSEVAFAGIKNSSVKKVTIAKTVKIGKKTFKVTSVADKALYKRSKVTSVTIGGNIKKIGKNAFYGCKRLKQVTIKATKIKSIGKNAFKLINAKAKIKVPAKKLSSYKKLLKGKGQSKTVKIIK